MIRIPCLKCSSVDIPKYRSIKNRGAGRMVPYLASYCIQCEKEDRRIYKARHHEKIKARMAVYIKEWDKKNRERRREIVNKHQRKKVLEKANPVNWHYTVSTGFSSLTYKEFGVR